MVFDCLQGDMELRWRPWLTEGEQGSESSVVDLGIEDREGKSVGGESQVLEWGGGRSGKSNPKGSTIT